MAEECKIYECCTNLWDVVSKYPELATPPSPSQIITIRNSRPKGVIQEPASSNVSVSDQENPSKGTAENVVAALNPQRKEPDQLGYPKEARTRRESFYLTTRPAINEH